jgi:hypothetical protein
MLYFYTINATLYPEKFARRVNMSKIISEIKCDGCPNSLKPNKGESEIKFMVRAVIAERWKVTIDRSVCKCPDCVERQVRRNLIH